MNEVLENARAARGGIHCGTCGRPVTKKNLSYILVRQFGRAEFKPICLECDRERNAVIGSEHSELSERNELAITEGVSGKESEYGNRKAET